MKRKMATFIGMGFCFCTLPLCAEPQLSNLRAEQIPGTKTVQLTYDLAADPGVTAVSVAMEFSTDDGATWQQARNAFGALGPNVAPGTDLAAFWDAGVDDPEHLVTAGRIKLKASADFILPPPGMLEITIDDPAYNPFTMGSPESESGRESDEVQHQVTLTQPFFLQKQVVTNAEFLSVALWAVANGYADFQPRTDSLTHPVSPTWYTAVAWCNARSEREGLRPVYYLSNAMEDADVVRSMPANNETPLYIADWSANGYRLPTEAEWEYACRAGTFSPYFSGDTEPAANVANNFGLLAMHEHPTWCWDLYAAYPSHAVTDPRGGFSGSDRVVRGNGRAAGRSKVQGDWNTGYVPSWTDIHLRPARNLDAQQ